MTYRLALLSEIALIERDGRHWTLDLWVKDLQAQVDAVQSVTLFSPVIDEAPQPWTLLALPESVRVVPLPANRSTIARELATVDVVQVPGNSTWRLSHHARVFIRMAHQAGKPAVLGISSDRATTHLVNARGQNILRRARARLRSLSVKISQRYLVTRCEGVFVVGEGLRRLVETTNSNVFVGTASWIRASDILPAATARRDPLAIRICAAARLEPMKGISLALEAMATLKARGDMPSLALLIAGQGPEESALRAQCHALQLQDVTRFAGSFGYPGPFFELLGSQDIVVLTNLNDEQPRLIFDAISQGCLIVCPDSLPYRALGIPDCLLYRRGDSAALAQALARAIAAIDDVALRTTLHAMARSATIESMHECRRDWVQSTVVNGQSALVERPAR